MLPKGAVPHGYEHLPVDFRGLSPGSSGQEQIRLPVKALDQDRQGFTHQSPQPFSGNFPLDGHQLATAIFLDPLGNLFGKPGSRRPLFRRKLENPEPVEADFGHKIQQKLKIMIGLAGKSDHHGGPQGQVRNAGTEAGQISFGSFPFRRPILFRIGGLAC